MTTKTRRMFRPRGGWGNNFGFMTDSRTKVYGHTTPRPRVGDWLVFPMQSGRDGVYIVNEIDLKLDPPDMWFATVEALGYLDEVAEPPEEVRTRYGGS